MTPAMIMAVAGGGALGSLLRYGLGNFIAHRAATDFPWGTLLINVLGSFVIGVLAESFALRWDATPTLRAFLVVGICGGFTTFSTFTLDAVVLLQRGAPVAAFGYVAGSVIAGLSAFMAATYITRHLI